MKYEYTSKGMASALAASVKDARAIGASPPPPTELQQLTNEVELLKKRKEKIELSRALEALTEPATPPDQN